MVEKERYGRNSSIGNSMEVDLKSTTLALPPGSVAGAKELLAAYASAGASHFVLRFAGDHEQHLELFAGVGAELSG